MLRGPSCHCAGLLFYQLHVIRLTQWLPWWPPFLECYAHKRASYYKRGCSVIPGRFTTLAAMFFGVLTIFMSPFIKKCDAHATAVTYVPLGFTIRSCELDYGIFWKWRRQTSLLNHQLWSYFMQKSVKQNKNQYMNGSLVPRPRFSQQRMDYITATWKVGLGKCPTKVVLRAPDFRRTIRMQCYVTSQMNSKLPLNYVKQY